MSLDDIKRKRQEDATTRDKELEATKAQLKARNQKKLQSKLDSKKGQKGGPKKDLPKNAPAPNVKSAGNKQKKR